MSEDNIRDMPEDWWPDSIHIVGKHGNVELCYTISEEMRLHAVEHFEKDLKTLRWAIWYAQQDPSSYEAGIFCKVSINAFDIISITPKELRPQGTI